MAPLKFVNRDYSTPGMNLTAAEKDAEQHRVIAKESALIITFCILEALRIHLGKKGSLSENGKKNFKIHKITIEFNSQYFSLAGVDECNSDRSSSLLGRLFTFFSTSCSETGIYSWRFNDGTFID